LQNNQWLYFRYMCTDGTLEKAMQAEEQGYDAVFISCNLDIGLYEARQLVDIPVTATLESAALIAHMMGASYSLVTVDHQNGNIQKMLLDRYGLSQHFVSQRPFGIDANDLYVDKTPPARIVQSVVETARTCVEEDGAEVIIPGCTLAGSVLTHEVEDVESLIGAPVLDGMVTGFKMAEMMADLHRSGLPVVSRRGFFEKPPRADMVSLREFLDRPLLGGWSQDEEPRS
jgi:allantoin racemase